MDLTKKLLLILLPVLVFFVIFNISNKKAPTTQPKTTDAERESTQVQILSTKPDPLDQGILGAEENIEITFNKPLQNIPEFKIRIEPKVEYQVELSTDRKTATIKFTKPLNLGTNFTLYIQPDTKFDEVGEWKEDKTFHFRTIKYTGV